MSDPRGFVAQMRGSISPARHHVGNAEHEAIFRSQRVDALLDRDQRGSVGYAEVIHDQAQSFAARARQSLQTIDDQETRAATSQRLQRITKSVLHRDVVRRVLIKIDAHDLCAMDRRISQNRSLKIREAIAAADKNDAQAQRDLSISFERLANTLRSLGELDAALSHRRRALTISQQLAQLAPLSVEMQRMLLVHHLQLAFIHQLRKDRAAAQQEAKAAADLLGALRARLPKQDAEGLDKQIRSLLR